MPFTGFSPRTLEFLTKLAAKNSKAWFEDHRNEYEEFLMAPMRALVVELSGPMMVIDPEVETRPAVNKTISKIYRDTRFSKNKALFKNNMWLTFKRPGGDWKGAPAFFFEINPDGYFYGMGFYSATPETMRNFREAIDAHPANFHKAIKFYTKRGRFKIGGEQYRRIDDSEVPDDIKPWYRRRNLYMYCTRNVNQRLFNKKLVGELTEGFFTLAPLYHYLWKVRASN
jgi:uncharacterized protein (TIGR02453 family)